MDLKQKKLYKTQNVSKEKNTKQKKFRKNRKQNDLKIESQKYIF